MKWTFDIDIDYPQVFYFVSKLLALYIILDEHP